MGWVFYIGPAIAQQRRNVGILLRLLDSEIETILADGAKLS